MDEPRIRIGFIIFQEGLQQEIEIINGKGHARTARIWVKNNNLYEKYEEVKEVNKKIQDEEDFLIHYIGAIKLHASSGMLRCYVPRTIQRNSYKSSLKRFYRNLGYIIWGDTTYEEYIHEVKNPPCNYNQTVIETTIKGEKQYIYNPWREGD